MLTQFEVKNFRCFRELALTDLERVNLIAGKNNVGKTSLLEALHLHCQPDKPHLWIKINTLRGIEDPFHAIDELGSWVFFHGQRDTPVTASSVDRKDIKRATQFYFLDAATSREKFPGVEKEVSKTFHSDIGGSDSPRLIVRYQVGAKKIDSVSLIRKSGHTTIPGYAPKTIPNVYLGSLIPDSKRDVRHFGELETAKRLGEIIPSLQILEPKLQRLSLIPLAGETTIHADMEGMPRLVPLPLIGEGMRRVLSMVLAIATVRGGIVFIDEFENGLHYSVLAKVWEAVADAARRNDVQVFATTHSWECLRAAHESFSQESQYDFRMHRLERQDGEVTSVAYDRELIETSLTMGLEVR